MQESSEIVVAPLPTGNKFINLTGRKFNRIEVVSFAGIRRTTGASTIWNCRCECGTLLVVPTGNLTSGHTQSCGCLRDELSRARIRHGFTGRERRRSEYRSWEAIKGRCRRPTDTAYPGYGARGINVCDHWFNLFENFYADMGDRPSPKHTIDRIDNDGNYSCGHCEQCVQNGWTANCRWATHKEQGNNKRSNRIITCGGVTGTVSEVAEKLGVKYSWLQGRYRPSRKYPPPPFNPSMLKSI